MWAGTRSNTFGGCTCVITQPIKSVGTLWRCHHFSDELAFLSADTGLITHLAGKKNVNFLAFLQKVLLLAHSKMRPNTSAATSVLLGIVVVVLSIAKPVCLGFSPPSAFGPRTTHYLASTKTKEPTTKEVTEEDGVNDDDRISELDARVLQSMLRDDKLDLGIEQNMRKLLERGIAPKSAPKVPKDTQQQQDNDEEGEYASQILKVKSDWSTPQTRIPRLTLVCVFFWYIDADRLGFVAVVQG